MHVEEVFDYLLQDGTVGQFHCHQVANLVGAHIRCQETQSVIDLGDNLLQSMISNHIFHWYFGQALHEHHQLVLADRGDIFLIED